MKSKLITVPEELLKDILPFVKGSKFEKEIKEILENTGKYQTQNISYFPKKGKVKRVVDGDTVVLENGSIVRYVGINSPETLYLCEPIIESPRRSQEKKIGYLE